MISAAARYVITAYCV